MQARMGCVCEKNEDVVWGGGVAIDIWPLFIDPLHAGTERAIDSPMRFVCLFPPGFSLTLLIEKNVYKKAAIDFM